MSRFLLESRHLPEGCSAPLDAPADAVCVIEWDGQKRIVLLRAVHVGKFAWLVFAKSEESDEVRVAVTFNGPMLLPVPIVWRERPSPSKLPRIAHQAATRSFFGWAHLIRNEHIENEP